jgi:hypothetical protein
MLWSHDLNSVCMFSHSDMTERLAVSYCVTLDSVGE